MDMESKLGKELRDIITSLDFIKPEDIPAIELYMDQVTTSSAEQKKIHKRTSGAADLYLLSEESVKHQ